MKNSIKQLLICGPLCKITFNISQLVKNANYTSCKEVFNFFFNPVNKNQKCIRNASEISEMSPTSEKSEMHQKCIRNNHFLPLPGPILKYILFFYTSTPNYCTLSLIPTFQHLPPTPK